MLVDHGTVVCCTESRCAGELFEWTDGTFLDYEAWALGEPNNYQVRS